MNTDGISLTDRRNYTMSEISSRRLFAFVLIGGVLVRVVALILISDFPMIADSHGYHGQALSLLKGYAFTPYFPPGTSLYLVPFYLIFGDGLLVGRMAFLILWVVFAILLYLMISSLTSKTAALVGVATLSFFPDWIYQSVMVWSQLLTATCIVSVIWLTHILGQRRDSEHSQQGVWLSMLLGATLGFAILVRPSTLLIIIVILLYLTIKKLDIKKLLIIFSVLIVVVITWIVKTYQMTGHITFINTANSYNLFLGNNEFTPLYRTWLLSWDENSRPLEYLELVDQLKTNFAGTSDSAYSQAAFEHILKRPDLFFFRTLNRVRAYWGYDVFAGQHFARGYDVSPLISGAVILGNAIAWFMLISLALLFLTTPLRKALPIEEILLILGIIITYSISIWIVFSHPNYHFPITPLVTIFASIAGDSIIKYLGDRKGSFKELMGNLLHYRLFILSWIVFLCIQIEWTIIVYAEYANVGYGIW